MFILELEIDDAALGRVVIYCVRASSALADAHVIESYLRDIKN